jgi:AraC-like DNA-binding protein
LRRAARGVLGVRKRVVIDDEFSADTRAWLASVATGALGLAGGAFGIARRLIAIALVAHALFVLWRGRRTDLVNERLGARHAALWIAGAYVIGVLAVELWLGGAPVPAWVQALNLGTIWLVSAATAITLTRWDLREPQELLVPRRRESMDARLRGHDELFAALERAMREERLYRQEGLAIAGLARHLGTQEHRLRRAINRGLGYRNFNEYLHRYRLEEVAARLKRADDAHLPILTLALEAGYASIGPFNRAFKARYGVTPSSYRAG